jgi:arylsulfatase
MLYTENSLFNYAQTPPKEWALFNLASDPSEDHDLAGTHPEVVRRMSDAYDSWWEKVRPSLINEQSE